MVAASIRCLIGLPPGHSDIFQSLRSTWTDWLAAKHVPLRLRSHIASGSEDPLFQPSEVAELRDIASAWFKARGHTVSWHVAEHQPYCLEALQLLATCMGDLDSTLWPCLQQGVPTGIDADIPKSNVFIPVHQAAEDVAECLHVCTGNWKQAEVQPQLLEELVAKEASEGWIFSMPDLESARSRWGERVAIGKCNIVGGDTVGGEYRKPRLIVDSTVSGANTSCVIPERFSLPGLADVINSMPLRGSSSELAGFSLDVRSAHKTVRIREADRGLLGFSAGDRLYFYRVAPFGGTFSALWFQRISAFLVRFFHLLLWIQHCLLSYVDDFFLIQPQAVIELGASLMLCACAVFGVPISFAKLQLGGLVRWIGWSFNLRAQVFSVPKDKLLKLLSACIAVIEPRTTSRKDLESLIGLLHWILQIAPQLKAWLSALYDDLARPLATSFSIHAGSWQSLATCLNDSMHFVSSPAGSGIPVGGKLLSAKHTDIRRKGDLRLVQPSGKRVWLRVADPRTDKRKLSAVSKSFIQFWMRWAISDPICRPLRPAAAASPHLVAADAMASGSVIGIGGFACLSAGSNPVWFAETFQVQDFFDLGLQMQLQAQRDITSYEILAQHALLVMVATIWPRGRLAICVPTLSDNTGAESSVNKLFSTTYPICMFLQKIATFSALTGITLEVGHIPGSANEEADLLSRWDGQSVLPTKWHMCNRVRLPLQRLWLFRSDVRLWPESASLCWQPPCD